MFTEQIESQVRTQGGHDIIANLMRIASRRNSTTGGRVDEDHGVGLRAITDQIAGAEDSLDVQGLQVPERLLQGPDVGVDVGDQSDLHGG